MKNSLRYFTENFISVELLKTIILNLEVLRLHALLIFNIIFCGELMIYIQVFVQPLSMLGTTSLGSTGVLLWWGGGGVTFKNEGGGAFKCHLNVGGRVKEKQLSNFQVFTPTCQKLLSINVKQLLVVSSDKRCHFYLFYASLLFGK